LTSTASTLRSSASGSERQEGIGQTLTALLFDSRLQQQVATHIEEFRTVRHFVAFGPDSPDWATTLVDVMAGQPSNEPHVEVDEEAPCFVQLTAGTTGRPRPWVKTYRSWWAGIDHNLHHLDTSRASEPRVGPERVNLHFTPIQADSGFQTLYPYVLRGSSTILVDDAVFAPNKVIEVLCHQGITGTAAPGFLLTKLLDEVEARGGIDHQLRRLVVRFATPELLERTTKLLGPVWAHGYG
jgi:acyl-CoA synthetase (AMP-forming)/AMP-acid ligase II